METAPLYDITQKFMKVDRKTVLRLSLDLSTQIMEFKYKQAYKMIETGVLVRKSKNMKSNRSIFFLLW